MVRAAATRLSPARKVALDVISERRRRSGRAREMLRSSQAMARLSPRDRALVSRLVFGVVSGKGTIDALIDRHARAGKLEPRVRDALEIACYEIGWLATPPAVAVSQGVELVRSVSQRSAGLANAILRKVAREDAPELDAAARRLTAGTSDLLARDAALVGAMPEWLVYQLLSARGREAASDFALAQLEGAPIYVATNLALMSATEAESRLKAAGLAPEPSLLPGSFVLRSPAELSRSGLVQNVNVVPTDLSAQLVASVAAARPGEGLLEVGQGRGTKTILLQSVARRLGGAVEIVALDSDEAKVRSATKRMAVAGVSAHVRSLAYDGALLDAEVVPPELDRTFDVVFVDAPCSGTGTLRRHPEIVWSLERTALKYANDESLPALQYDLLCGAASRVKEGGRLVYSTCSVLGEENELVADAFLESEEGEGFEREDIMGVPGIATLPAATLEAVSAALTPGGYLQTMTSPGGPDGHFCASFVRT